MNITYKEIGEYCNKVESTMKQMKKNNPEQLELLKMGALCKKYNITIEDLKALNEMKEKLK
jgi:hypothetical protein